MIIAVIPNAINTQPYNSAIQTAAKACTPPFIASHIGIKTEPVSDAASIFLVYIGFVSVVMFAVKNPYAEYSMDMFFLRGIV